MVSLTGLTLSAPSSARSTPAPPLRLPSLSEVAGPELLSLDLVKYSEWLNVLPFYTNGTASLPEPVYDFGFDVWQMAQNKSDRGRGVQAGGLQRSFSLPTTATSPPEPLPRSNSQPVSVSPPLFQEHKTARKLSVDEQLSRTATPKPLFAAQKATPVPQTYLKLPSVSQILQDDRTSAKSQTFGIPPNPTPLPPLRREKPPAGAAPQQPVYGISQHLPSSNSMLPLYDEVVYQPLGPVYKPAGQPNEQAKSAKSQAPSQPTSYSVLRAAQERIQRAHSGSQPRPEQHLLNSPAKKSSLASAVPAKVPSRVAGYDTEAARTERHRSKSTSPIASKREHQIQDAAHIKSVYTTAISRSQAFNRCKSRGLVPLNLQPRGNDLLMSTLPTTPQAQPPYSMIQTGYPMPFIIQQITPTPTFTAVQNPYAVPGSILLSMDYRFVYLGRDCATWLHLNEMQLEALPRYSMLVLCVQSDVKALQNFLKLARTEIQYHDKVRAAAIAAGRMASLPTDGRTMSQTFNLTRGDGHVEPFVLTISLSLRMLQDRPTPVFSGTLIPLWMSMTTIR